MNAAMRLHCLILNANDNQFLVVNQYTIIENNQNKRPDVILFVNGIPLVVIELKNASDENADMRSAFKQIQTYKSNYSITVHLQFHLHYQ